MSKALKMMKFKSIAKENKSERQNVGVSNLDRLTCEHLLTTQGKMGESKTQNQKQGKVV